MYDVDGVALADQVVYGPLEGTFAALGEVHRHTDLPITCHLLDLRLPLGIPYEMLWRKPEDLILLLFWSVSKFCARR